MTADDSILLLEVRVAAQASEARRCWPVFRELRPHILTPDDFLTRWERQQAEGYTLAYVEAHGEVIAAAGFRFMTTMAWGRILYLDDLGALKRGAGFGTRLIQWLQERARAERCDGLHLDTGYQRHLAHKAYLRNGLTFDCHHLAWRVPQ